MLFFISGNLKRQAIIYHSYIMIKMTARKSHCFLDF